MGLGESIQSCTVPIAANGWKTEVKFKGHGAHKGRLRAGAATRLQSKRETIGLELQVYYSLPALQGCAL